MPRISIPYWLSSYPRPDEMKSLNVFVAAYVYTYGTGPIDAPAL